MRGVQLQHTKAATMRGVQLVLRAAPGEHGEGGGAIAYAAAEVDEGDAALCRHFHQRHDRRQQQQARGVDKAVLQRVGLARVLLVPFLLRVELYQLVEAIELLHQRRHEGGRGGGLQQRRQQSCQVSLWSLVHHPQAYCIGIVGDVKVDVPAHLSIVARNQVQKGGSLTVRRIHAEMAKGVEWGPPKHLKREGGYNAPIAAPPPRSAQCRSG